MGNENKCRTCCHSWEEHSHCGRAICVYSFDDKDGNPYEFCNCKTGWIPSDNLEFLEYKYGSKLDKKFSSKSDKNL